VVVALSALWLLVSVLVSLVPRTLAEQNAPQNAVRNLNSDIVARAERAHSYNDWAAAAALLDGVDATAPMSVMEKHTYFRVGAQSKQRNGNAAAAVGYYERYLAFGLQIANAECAGCHAGPSAMPPKQVTDLENSTLGTEYAASLAKSGQLKQTRERLTRDLKKRPKDPRPHLLLFHLDKAGGDAKAAARHSEVLRTLQPAATGG
jgi:hypothetical protein